MSRIAERNDKFRVAVLTEPQKNGRCFVTQGVHALGADMQMSILQKVRTFDNFTEDNDPHGEHDFGALEILGIGKIYWKIDYYANADMEAGTRDTENAYRVLTIMEADEY